MLINSFAILNLFVLQCGRFNLQVDEGLVSHFLGAFPTAVLQLLHAPDLDLQEKALGALQSLLSTNHAPVAQALEAHHAGGCLC